MDFFNIDLDEDLSVAKVSSSTTASSATGDATVAISGKGLFCRADKKYGACELEKDHGFIKVCKGNPCR